MLLTGIRLILFILSMSGYILYIQRKSKIQVEFIPVISIAGLTIILFVSGLLNLLLLTSYSLFGIGVILLVKEIYYNNFNKSMYSTFSKFVTPGILIFFMTSLYFIFMLKNQRLIHYDNFSHWAIIVKNVLMNDALPNFEDTIIGFNTYPPGSVLYIYYFSKIVGVSEGIALIAQMSVILSGLLALFSFSSFSLLDSKENKQSCIKKMVLTLITLLVSLYVLDGPSTIHNLLVDTLLNTTGLALFALTYYYLDSIERIVIPVAVLVSFLTLIKNSGVFFGVIALFFYAYGLRKYWRDSTFNLIRFKSIIFIPFISPVVIDYLWRQHISMVFQTGRVGKHTMSVNSYLTTYNEKTPGEIQEISLNYLNTLYNKYAYQLLFIILLIVGLIVLKKITSSYLDKRLVKMLLVVLGIFVLYSLGLWIMYLVSMPTAESMFLAGYGRYMDTIMDYLMGVTAISLIYSLSKSNSNRLIIITNTVMIVCFTFLTIGNKTQSTLSIFKKSEFAIETDYLSVTNIDEALTNISNNPLKSTSGSKYYYVYYPKEESESVGYEQYFLSYRLYENTGKITRNFDEIEELWTYDYLSVTLVTDEVIDIFERYSKDIPKIGTYKIDKDKKTIGTK